MDDVSSPRSFVRVLGPPRIDSRERDTQLTKNTRMVIRHRVVTRNEHPGRWITHHAHQLA